MGPLKWVPLGLLRKRANLGGGGGLGLRHERANLGGGGGSGLKPSSAVAEQINRPEQIFPALLTYKFIFIYIQIYKYIYHVSAQTKQVCSSSRRKRPKSDVIKGVLKGQRSYPKTDDAIVFAMSDYLCLPSYSPIEASRSELEGGK